jgi:hypothetical protein
MRSFAHAAIAPNAAALFRCASRVPKKQFNPIELCRYFGTCERQDPRGGGAQFKMERSNSTSNLKVKAWTMNTWNDETRGLTMQVILTWPFLHRVR